jgi:hypothetical protein
MFRVGLNMLTLDYMAGMMDADGHFTWRAGKWQCPDVGVTNTSGDLMGAIDATFGGSVSRQRTPCADGCVLSESHSIHRRMSIYKWHMTGYRAVLFCRALAPLLVIKGGQALELAEQWHEALATMERPKRRLHHMAKEQAWWNAGGWN